MDDLLRVSRLDDPAGRAEAERLIRRLDDEAASCRDAVAEILARVRREGDAALLDYTRRFDMPEAPPDMAPADLRVTEAEFAAAESGIDPALRASIEFAAGRIRAFHRRELPDSWLLTQREGVITGRLVRPVDAAGLYVPGGRGGTTPLVSSVLMTGVPAKIAGVERLVMVTPPNREGRVHPALLVAARILGVSEVYKLGSAWAVAALAFGTESIRPVDVIAGPGNQYVAEAKRQVMGRARIDMLAGPSEVLIVADETARPAFIAADMLAQAEHDPQALALAIVASMDQAEATRAEIGRQLPNIGRAEIARQALATRGHIFVASDTGSAVELANEIASEHLELHVADPWSWLPRLRHAGAVFLGHYSPEASGDYVAGPNHVLPTMGTARTASALGVDVFLKQISLINYSREALAHDADHIRALARLESLDAHAESVSERLKD